MMRRRNLRVTEQLLGELEAGRFDSALTRRILEAPSAFPRLLRACFLAEARQLASARADVDEAIELAPDNPVIQLVAGMVLYSTRDYQRALDQFTRASGMSKNAARRARHLAIGACGGLGWDHDVRRVLEQAIADDPEHAAWHAKATHFYARGRHWQRALEHGRAALALAPDAGHLWMEVAGLHARLNQREAAVEALNQALARVPTDEERLYRLEAARTAIDASAFDLALDCYARALALDPSDPTPLVAQAEIASWRGDDDEAAALTERALALDPELAAAIRMQGALEVRAERYTDAIATLGRAIAIDPEEYQAHLWLSEAYLRLERYDEAHDQLHNGTMHAGGFLFQSWLIRFLIVAGEGEDPQSATVTPNRTEEFDDVLRELCPELAERALASRDLADTVAAVEAALRALEGNRSIYPTHLLDGELTRMRTRSGCRFESRWILQLLRVSPGEACLARYDELIPRYPGSSLPICHRGELHLWLGNVEEARADLERAIELVEGTRWAYMGLSTLDLVAGDYQACLDLNARGVRVMQNTEGPAIHVYRGEALRKLGRLDEAIAELEQAVQWHPARASATINLALAYAAKHPEDPEDPEFELLWRRLADEQACGLLSDAARELGETIVGDDGWAPTRATKVRVLERALEMMGYNRSSGLLTYWTADGQLRFVQHWPHSGHGPHARDRDHLNQAKQLLLKALAAYSGPRTP